MDVLHKHVIGIDRPLRRNPFWKCPSYLPNKMSKRSIGKRTNKHKKCKADPSLQYGSECEKPPVNNIDDKIEGNPGQHFHMDFVFVRNVRRRQHAEMLWKVL